MSAYYVLFFTVTVFAALIGDAVSIITDSGYKHAAELESQGRYKEACYAYGDALMRGKTLYFRRCKKRIRYLWNAFGPFDFFCFLKEIQRQLSEPGTCSSAFSMIPDHFFILFEIENAVQGKQKTRTYWYNMMPYMVRRCFLGASARYSWRALR